MNARKQDYSTPMHLSATNGYIEIVKPLLEHGADMHALNGKGETPYRVSLRRGNREIVDLLWQHGASSLGEGSTRSYYDLNAVSAEASI
jgi:ankyrin repeat protein